MAVLVEIPRENSATLALDVNGVSHGAMLHERVACEFFCRGLVVQKAD